jgi:hypothetical protein
MNLFTSLQKRLLFTLIQLVVVMQVNGQVRIYEAFVEGNKVGEMQVIREVNDESEKITVTTDLDAHPFSTENVHSESHATYMDGKLMEATATRKINGRLHSKVTASFDDSGFFVVKDGEEQVIEQHTVYGIDLFYCEEPEGIEEVFDLTSGGFVAVEYSEGHVYYVIRGEKKERYRYENGLLQGFQVEHKRYSVVFKLKQ